MVFPQIHSHKACLPVPWVKLLSTHSFVNFPEMSAYNWRHQDAVQRPDQQVRDLPSRGHPRPLHRDVFLSLSPVPGLCSPQGGAVLYASALHRQVPGWMLSSALHRHCYSQWQPCPSWGEPGLSEVLGVCPWQQEDFPRS